VIVLWSKLDSYEIDYEYVMHNIYFVNLYILTSILTAIRNRLRSALPHTKHFEGRCSLQSYYI
jgi:hypothetical protein